MVTEYYQAELHDKPVFVRVKFKPPFRAKQSMISEACLMYNVKGPSHLYGADQTLALSAENGAFMKCGNYISDWQATEQNETFEVITIHFFPEILQELFANDIPDYLQNPSSGSKRVMQKINESLILKSYIDSLLIYFDNPALFNADTIKLKLKELIALLHTLDSNDIREILAGLFSPYELDFKKVVEAHLYHPLSLDDFSALAGMSVSSFTRKFKEIYRTSPGQYMLAKRLEKASYLLTASTKRIGDICYESGFNDLSNFTKYFKSHYGMAPSAFRKSKAT